VRNSWVRGVTFTSVSAAVEFETCLNSVGINNVVQGKSGHSSFVSKRGYGNLFSYVLEAFTA
jgi:hypothetical protein